MKTRAKTQILKALALAGGALVIGAAGPAAHAVETVAPRPAVAEALPVASDARIAGDDKQTRFILDLDRKIDVRAFVLADPYRVVVDIPQTTFNLPAGSGVSGRGLIRSFRYGMVMPGASRVVFDLTGPSKIEKSYVLDGANDQPPRLIVELAAVDRAAFKAASAAQGQDKQGQDKQAKVADAPLRPAILADAAPDNTGATPLKVADTRPVIVLDPGHGGIDNGTVAESGENEKDIVLDFAKALRERIEKAGKYRVVMTRTDDTFVPLGDRVKIARNQTAALFVSIHADALPKSEGDAQGATIYTLSDKA
ncbi:MAG: N-acetylmuramoyl-L-alanine amidase, partial [Xanthobacteraceae bacterium]|nr:N-acetylmuramoyl-L-alanine amidase [Xanthobacteraceae bacterium]